MSTQSFTETRVTRAPDGKFAPNPAAAESDIELELTDGAESGLDEVMSAKVERSSAAETNRIMQARDSLARELRGAFPEAAEVRIDTEMEGPYVTKAVNHDGSETDLTDDTSWPEQLDRQDTNDAVRHAMCSWNDDAIKNVFGAATPGEYRISTSSPAQDEDPRNDDWYDPDA